MSEAKVSALVKSGWCNFCCSNHCYCSKENLMRQLASVKEALHERNEKINDLEKQLAQDDDRKKGEPQ